jgi:hypothetical protein
MEMNKLDPNCLLDFPYHRLGRFKKKPWKLKERDSCTPPPMVYRILGWIG